MHVDGFAPIALQRFTQRTRRAGQDAVVVPATSQHDACPHQGGADDHTCQKGESNAHSGASIAVHVAGCSRLGRRLRGLLAPVRRPLNMHHRMLRPTASITRIAVVGACERSARATPAGIVGVVGVAVPSTARIPGRGTAVVRLAIAGPIERGVFPAPTTGTPRRAGVGRARSGAACVGPSATARRVRVTRYLRIGASRGHSGHSDRHHHDQQPSSHHPLLDFKMNDWISLASVSIRGSKVHRRIWTGAS